MTTEAWVTLIVMIAAMVVMATDRLPLVLVMSGAVATLLLTNTIDEATALSGFSSSAPLTIAALYVLAGAATSTGAPNRVVDRVLDHPRHALARLLGSTAALSSVMPNTPLVAVLAPRVVTWARRNRQPASRYLLPLSFASVLGGVVTLIGTSTNLVVSDILRRQGHGALDVFEMTAVGLPVAAVGVAVLLVVAPRLLPDRQSAADSMRATARRFHVVMTVDDDGPLTGSPVGASGLRLLDGIELVAVERDGRVLAARDDRELRGGDRCMFVGDVGRILDLQETPGLTSAERSHVLDTDRPGARLFEAVVSQQSPLVGRTLREVRFRTHYDAAVLAVHRPGGEVEGSLDRLVLRSGDVLLLLASPEFDGNWKDRSDFALIASLDDPPPARRHRAWLPVAALVGMVAITAANVVTLFEASLIAAAVVVAGGAISFGDARRSVNLNVVLTIALSVSLGAAVEATGLAAEIGQRVASLTEPFGVVGQLTGVLVATMLLTEVLSNNGAAAVMLPVALSVAAEAGADLRAFAIAVLIGASCSFLSPIGYQTNLMVYGLGGYRFGDFTRVGLPLTVVTAVVTPIAIWVFWL